MEALDALRLGLQLYAALLAVLGLVTLAWALANVVLFDTVTLAVGWFAAAGFGTVLLALLFARSYPTTLGDRARRLEVDRPVEARD